MNILKNLWDIIQAFFAQQEEVYKPIHQTAVLPPSSKYDWSSREAARHSLRLIADEENLTVEQKDLMSKVVHCESGYNVNATNKNIVNGKTASEDFGICQWNDYWHGKEITPDEALHNPEKAVRLMCKYVKLGQIKQWVCYSKNLYQHYSS